MFNILTHANILTFIKIYVKSLNVGSNNLNEYTSGITIIVYITLLLREQLKERERAREKEKENI